MRTEALMRAVALVPMLALPIACGSSSPGGTSGGSDATTGGPSGTSTTTGGGGKTGASSTGGATSSGTATGGIPGLGASCTFNVNTGADTCTQYGLECTSTISWVFCEGLDYPCPPTASNQGGAGTCALPEEIGACMPSVGCQDAGSPTKNGESDQFSCLDDQGYVSCLYTCADSNACANITENCQSVKGQGACVYNYCNVNSHGGFDAPFFNACDAAGTGDGQCLSWGGMPAAGAVCYQVGTIPKGEVCHTYRTGGADDQLCAFGYFCVPTPADQTVGVCMELTDGTFGQKPCTDSSDRTLYDVIGANFGVCSPLCSDGGTCPPNLSCQDIAGSGKSCVP